MSKPLSINVINTDIFRTRQTSRQAYFIDIPTYQIERGRGREGERKQEEEEVRDTTGWSIIRIVLESIV